MQISSKEASLDPILLSRSGRSAKLSTTFLMRQHIKGYPGYEMRERVFELEKRKTGKRDYFKDFFANFQSQIVSSEFWQLNLFEILELIKSEKEDEHIKTHLFNYIQDEKAIEYLLFYRREISEDWEEAQSTTQERQVAATKKSNRMKVATVGAGAGFASKSGKADDDPLTNHDVLKMIGVSDETVEQDSKLGLKPRKELGHGALAPKNQVKFSQIDVDTTVARQLKEMDFVGMTSRRLAEVMGPKFKKLEDDDLYMSFEAVPPPKFDRKEEKVENLFPVTKLPQWAQRAFGREPTLNVIQTKVRETALHTSENLLIAAPTGAGKTNIAVLSILHEVGKHIDEASGRLKDNDFKIIYISPMKALAQEIVDKFSEKLEYLGVKVKEYTGDVQLTRQEIHDTHILVATPEKWDVVTRKTEGITAMLKLIILDEVHLLDEDRGQVLESIVARSLRTMERNQSRVRLVGLSATLPNYKDVALFLKVKAGLFYFDASYRPVPLHMKFIGVKQEKKQAPKKQDASGADAGGKNRGKGKQNEKKPPTRQERMNEKAFEIVKQNVRKKEQVLVFVHSRKETVTTALDFIERIEGEGLISAFRGNGAPVAQQGRSKDLNKLVPYGIGIHNAGLQKKDRNFVEKAFLSNQLMVVICTATLAWGVNLPAHAVVIKGTDVYEPGVGWKNLSILDVQQIFGRAGRPQFDTSGEATLITKIETLNHFMSMLNNVKDIESQFMKGVKEALNAEIALGTVTTIFEAFQWVQYTFFFIRAHVNPTLYFVRNDGRHIEERVMEMIEQSLESLNEMKFIRFSEKSSFIESTELGRVTSAYYVNCNTMKIFCEAFGFTGENSVDYRGYFEGSDVLAVIARADEFSQLTVRNDEVSEVNKLKERYNFFNPSGFFKTSFKPKFIQKGKGTTENEGEEFGGYKVSGMESALSTGASFETHEKVLILFQAYLGHAELEAFSLVADTNYIIQNGSRLLRCILDIALKKAMAPLALTVIHWCKIIESGVRDDETPLRQFTFETFSRSLSAQKRRHEVRMGTGFINSDICHKLEGSGGRRRFEEEVPVLTLEELREIDKRELCQSYHMNDYMASQVKRFASYIPFFEVESVIRPVAQTILKINLTLRPQWYSVSLWHGKSEHFWLVVDDGPEILHHESFSVSQKQLIDKAVIDVSFFIPFSAKSRESKLCVSIVSDKFVGGEQEILLEIDENAIILEKMEYTELLDLRPLPKSALCDPRFESLCKFNFFNPIQTQLFHTLYHSDENILVGAPTGSGKTVLAEIAIFRTFNKSEEDQNALKKEENEESKPSHNRKVIYIAPFKALAKERLKDWKTRLEDGAPKKKVLELTGDYTPDLEALVNSDVLITTPEKWDGISRSWHNREYVQKVDLIIFDEIHMLGQDRGPVIEMIVSRMNFISKSLSKKIRMIGLSTAMANSADVANWFGVSKHCLFNFRPSVRPVPIEIHFDGFAEKHYCPRMATMNKPAYNCIKKFSDGKSVLIFVSSRRQTRLTALDLISLVASDSGGRSSYLKMSQDEVQLILENVEDSDLKQTLIFGIGMHHAGLSSEDRKIVEALFVEGRIQVIVATSTLAWGVNFPAKLVIIKGTEFFDPKSKKYVDMPVTDILQMIGRAGRPQFNDSGVACVFVEKSKKNFYRRYLNDPFPIESHLESQLADHINAEIASGSITSKQACLDFITWTYYFRRVMKNPQYYGIVEGSIESMKEFLIKLIDKTVDVLVKHKCVQISEDGLGLEPTFLGRMASFYYLKYQTVSWLDSQLKAKMPIRELVRVLSNCSEFDEVPVRHNEDNLNEALASICPYKVEMKKIGSPQVKVDLMFQAYFSRLPLPIRDYITDTKLVIDSSTRMVQGMMDIAAEKGLLSTVISIAQFSQMITQGVWINSSALVNLPHLGEEKGFVSKMASQGIRHLAQLLSLHRNNKLKELFQAVGISVSKEEMEEIKRALDQVPDVSFHVKAVAYDSEKEVKAEEGAPFEEGGEAHITVNLKRLNPSQSLRVEMKRYLKVKDASWWMVIGCEATDELLCIKRLFFKSSLKRELVVSLPETFGSNPKISVWLLSDSYIGIDQVYNVYLKG